MTLLVGCGDRSSQTQHAVNQPSTPVETPPPSLSQPPPNPDTELAKALDALGAKQTDQGRVLRLSSAQFAPGQTKFEPTDASRWDRIVTILREHPETRVKIEGYTDSRGNKVMNQRIARKRADAVRGALIKEGIKAWRLSARGRGAANPMADNSTAEGREKNRRVELTFSDTRGNFATIEPMPTTG